jgi:hypothetical protein
MNDSTLFERNDTGILSLADLFRHDRLPCRVEPKRGLPPSVTPRHERNEGGPAGAPAPSLVPRP